MVEEKHALFIFLSYKELKMILPRRRRGPGKK
jgi:hypothetical protein